MILEICANSFQSAVNAETEAADRIELCQNLEQGGITPSFGLIAKVKQQLTIPVHVLIRPRPGDFVYNDEEFDIMLRDIDACRQLNCDGVVVGVLTDTNCVDVPRLTRLVQAAASMSVTFHRAFDDCNDQMQALEDIAAAGCKRILTSGGAGSALEGGEIIAQLVQRSNDRIIVMPGAGITAANIQILCQTTAATEFHASAKATLAPTSTSMFQTTQLQTCPKQVKELKTAMHQHRHITKR